MKKETDPNSQAFATPPIYDEYFGFAVGEKGLTKREYFAAMAMQGYLARDRYDGKTLSEIAVEMADALIEALNK